MSWGLPSGASSKGAPHGVQDAPYSLEIAGLNPGYVIADRDQEFPGGGAQLTERLPVRRLESVSWRVDYTLSSSELREVNEPTVLLRFQVNGPDPASKEPIVASLTAEKFRVLLTELKQAQVMMNALN